ncbi:hypothetical protein D9600_10185 [Deinococcus sp. DB0503]|nr:hypothetical protein [Deinococcus sp. DB0503]
MVGAEGAGHGVGRAELFAFATPEAITQQPQGARRPQEDGEKRRAGRRPAAGAYSPTSRTCPAGDEGPHIPQMAQMADDIALPPAVE